MDCFVASLLAMTANPNIPSRSRDALRPSRAFSLRPQRGRGECRMPNAPAASCAIVVVERTRVTTSTPESPGIPARNGFTAYVVLFRATGLFCHRRLANMVLHCPVGLTKPPQDLTPASGRQDHTILPYAKASLVSVLSDRSQVSSTRPAIHRALNAAAPTATHPAFRDGHDTPLLWGGMARICRDDLPDG